MNEAQPIIAIHKKPTPRSSRSSDGVRSINQLDSIKANFNPYKRIPVTRPDDRSPPEMVLHRDTDIHDGYRDVIPRARTSLRIRERGDER